MKISADWVYPVASPPLKDGILILDRKGTVLDILPAANVPDLSVRKVRGALVPGFINAHCHLELSHMKGKVDTGTGLIPFIYAVVTKRAAEQEEISSAIAAAEAEMISEGIVAVGDISNTADTFPQKNKANLAYYNFIEMFDFFKEGGAGTTFNQYEEVFQELQPAGKSKKVRVPHAPYTVSSDLFRMVREHNGAGDHTISIHNQEMLAENRLFLDKTGDLLDFYRNFELSLDNFDPIGKGSIYYAMANLDPDQKTLFVHNTLTTPAEILAAQAWSDKVYWATCPNANLYIENNMPDYRGFIDSQARVTIGTDSLTSNWQLSVLEEMKTIARYQSFVDFETLLRWSTINGAEALGFDDFLGSFERGKRPGVNLLNYNPEAGNLHSQVTVEKII